MSSKRHSLKKNKLVAKELFHRLKGSAGNSGITAIFEICKLSEEMILNEDWKAAEKSFTEVDKVLRFLQEEIKSRTLT